MSSRPWHNLLYALDQTVAFPLSGNTAAARVIRFPVFQAPMDSQVLPSRESEAASVSRVPCRINRALAQWIQYPKAIHGNTAMPVLRVTSRDADDIEGYLSSLK